MSIDIEQRRVQLPMPTDVHWPAKLHDRNIAEAARETLPRVVTALADAVPPLTRSDVVSAFGRGLGNRRAAWEYSDYSDGSFTFVSAPHKSKIGRRKTNFGIRFGFDKVGRLTEYALLDEQQFTHGGEPHFQETFTYDDEGFVQSHTVRGFSMPIVVDSFEYRTLPNAKKQPTAMRRIVHAGMTSSPEMVVDLADYDQWLTANPDGYKNVTKESLSPNELSISEYRVEEVRSGILFSSAEELEQALIMYGQGSYPTGETGLTHNVKVLTTEVSPLAGELLSTFAGSQDIVSFVQEKIMAPVHDAEGNEPVEGVRQASFAFDYFGAGNFSRTRGSVTISDDGYELQLGAYGVGNQVEENLAAALGKNRGLRSTKITVPVNQTDQEGSFLVDLEQVCKQLGITVPKRTLREYLDAYCDLGNEGDNRYDRLFGRRAPLWQDSRTGATVQLTTRRCDGFAGVDVDEFFGHDDTSLWGPLPKSKETHGEPDFGETPLIRVIIEPKGKPFEYATSARSRATANVFVTRLQDSGAQRLTPELD